MAQIQSSRGLAVLGVKAGNDKLGSGVHTTSVTQLSCPDGENNSYRCPLYDSGCYAEGGFLGMPKGTTTLVNKAAGLDRKEGSASSEFTPLDAAKDEAEVITKVVQSQKKLPDAKWPLMRLHIVGDAVTAECARTIAGAVGDYPALIDTPGMKVQKVWGYTHAWRSVDRGAWGSHISMMASCDGPDDVQRAWSRGFGACIVVPCFKSKTAYDSGLGFKILPCPNESLPAVNGKKVLCKDCRLCLRDKWLKDKGMVIAFKVHHGNAKVKEALKEKLYPVFGRCGE